MPPAETKTGYMVVRCLNHCPDLEEPPAPSATPQEEHTQASAIKVNEVPVFHLSQCSNRFGSQVTS